MQENSKIKYTVIFNATNIGKRLNGIGMYSLNLLKYFSKLQTHIQFKVYVNRNCRPHLRDIIFPENITLHWVSPRLSPDYKFSGHLLRLLYSNLLSLKYRQHLIFNTSQLEISFFASRQIITIHDIIPLLFKKYHKKQYYFFKYFLSGALKRVQAVITPSQHSKALILKYYRLEADKVQVVPCGVREVEEVNHPSSLSEKEKIILYAGRISPTKNITGLVKAFELIKDKIAHQLVIAGESRDFLEQEIKSGHLSRRSLEGNRISVTGYLDDQKLQQLMSRAEVFVYPSLYEGFGFPPLEAMRCGCPVIVSNSSSLPEVCGEAAYYVKPNNPQEIAAALSDVLTNRDLREQMIQQGFSQVRNYRWDISTARHLKLFEKMMGAKPVTTRPAQLPQVLLESIHPSPSF